MSTSVVVAGGVQSPRFLDVVRQTGLRRFARADAAEGWVDWTRRFILFHPKRHPRDMGAAEIGQFLQRPGFSLPLRLRTVRIQPMGACPEE